MMLIPCVLTGRMVNATQHRAGKSYLGEAVGISGVEDIATNPLL
jgi:hypothetical protein